MKPIGEIRGRNAGSLDGQVRLMPRIGRLLRAARKKASRSGSGKTRSMCRSRKPDRRASNLTPWEEHGRRVPLPFHGVEGGLAGAAPGFLVRGGRAGGCQPNRQDAETEDGARDQNLPHQALTVVP